MKLLPDKFSKQLIILFTLLCISYIGNAQTVIPPNVSYVSINPYTNEVSVAWYKSPSDNILFTRIHYIYDETGLIKAKTIIDIQENSDDTLFFKTDSIAIFPYEANEKQLSFAVDAYATNGTNSTSLREYHTTMNTQISLQDCPSQLQLTWTPYIGYGIEVSTYIIIEVDKFNTEQTLYTLASTATNQAIPLNSNSERRFFVEAHFVDTAGNAQISRSNMVYIKTPVYTSPSYIQIQSLHITDMNDVIIDFAVDTATSFTNYKVQRSINNGSFNTILTIELNKQEISPYRFTHTNAYNSDTAVQYRLVAYNNCKDVIRTSQPTQLFTAQATEVTDTKHFITWNMPTIWPEGVAQYTIYRIKDNGSTEEIATTSQANTYIDDIGTQYDIGAKVCYRIEALQNKNTDANTSTTNVACVVKTYRLLLPNAINPISSIEENRIFKPTYAFIPSEYKLETALKWGTGELEAHVISYTYISDAYLLQIFDRYGTSIFESTSIEHGWDGTYKNKNVSPGSYHYKIKIKVSDNTTIEKQGSVSVVYDK